MYLVYKIKMENIVIGINSVWMQMIVINYQIGLKVI